MKEDIIPLTCSRNRSPLASIHATMRVTGEVPACMKESIDSEKYLQQKTEKLGLFRFPGANRSGRKAEVGVA